MNKTIVHIGSPKAGSTTLQRSVFQDLPSIRCLIPADHNQGLSSADKDCYKSLWKQGFISESNDQEIASRVKAIHDSLAASDDRIMVVSSENMQLIDSPCSLSAVAHRLKTAFPYAHILLVSRPQEEIIRSFYDMYPTDVFDGSQRPLGFAEWSDKFLFCAQNPLREFLRFEQTASLFRQVFGHDKFTHLSFQGLFLDHDPLELQALASILDSSTEDLILKLSRRYNPKSLHRASKLSRRLFGRFHLSSLLPSSFARATSSLVSGLLPQSLDCRPALETSLKIRSFYN